MQVLIDSSKKYFWQWFGPILFGLGVTVWGVFVRPQIVMASDLKVVADKVDRIEKKVDLLADAQTRQQILYYEDQIRILEVTAAERPLTPTETQRLLRYKSDLEHIKQ